MKKRTCLSNGVTIVTEQLAYFRMVHVQIRMKVGSGSEGNNEWGAAHFLEHLTFTSLNGSGFGFSCKMADYGAMVQAKTSFDHTVYQIDVPADNLLPVLQLLLELITNKYIDSECIEVERSVILSELNMVMDDKFESDLNKFYENMFEGYGHPVIGTEESIRGLSLTVLQDFRDRFYTPDNMQIGIAGNVNHEDVVKEMKRILGNWFGVSSLKAKPIVRETFSRIHVPSNSENVTLMWGFKAPSYQDEERFAFSIMMKSFTGDGTDIWAHLFHLIRTKLGLAYTVGGEYLFLDQVGIYFFTVITQPEHLEKIIEIVEREMELFLKGEIPLKLQRAIMTLSSDIYNEEDQLLRRVARVLDRELCEYIYPTAEEECSMLAKITEEDLLRTAANYLCPKLLMIIGSTDSSTN